MGGLPSGSVGLEGPVGGALESFSAAGPVGGCRSSFRARGPVGGTLPVAEPASVVEAVRFGTDPNEGAAGATGGGDTSLLDGAGS
jgi:hypothetical protein